MDDFKALDLFDDGTNLEMCSEELNLSGQKVILTQTKEISETTSKILKNETSNESNQEDSSSPRNLSKKTEIKITNEADLETVNDKKDTIQENINEIFLKKIEVMYEQLSKKLSNMETLFDKRIMYTDHEDKIINQMHAELQKYKEDLYAQLIRPVLLDIIEVRDSIMRISKTYLNKPEGEQAIPNKIFADYAYDLQDILEKNNVEIYHGNRGDSFVAVKQQIIKKEATNNEDLHGKIANSLSCGYSYAGRVISAEKVSVYFYERVEESEDNLNG